MLKPNPTLTVPAKSASEPGQVMGERYADRRSAMTTRAVSTTVVPTRSAAVYVPAVVYR